MFNSYSLNEYIENKALIHCRLGSTQKNPGKGTGSLRVQGKKGQKIPLEPQAQPKSLSSRTLDCPDKSIVL